MDLRTTRIRVMQVPAGELSTRTTGPCYFPARNARSTICPHIPHPAMGGKISPTCGTKRKLFWECTAICACLQPYLQLNDVVGNEDAVSRLKCIARDGNMPHLILTVNLSKLFPGLTWLDKRAGCSRNREDNVRPRISTRDARRLFQRGCTRTECFWWAVYGSTLLIRWSCLLCF